MTELGLDVPLREVVPVLGVPVTFRYADPMALEAIEQSFGWWRALLEYPSVIAEIGVTVSVVVTDGDEGHRRPVPFDFQMPDPKRFLVHTPGSMGMADLERGDAVVYVTRRLLEQRDRFRFGMLDGLTLLLVASRDRQPLHAALIRRGDAALVLAAPSGTGKSSVAYAAARAGWELLSDDATYVQLRAGPRIWGRPGVTYLPEDVARRFLELDGRRAEQLPNGKIKVAVRLETALTGPPFASRVGVCLLARGEPGQAVTRERVSPQSIAEFLRQGLGPQRALYADTIGPAAQWASAGGGWRLRLSDDPRAAVPVLDGLAIAFGSDGAEEPTA